MKPPELGSGLLQVIPTVISPAQAAAEVISTVEPEIAPLSRCCALPPDRLPTILITSRGSAQHLERGAISGSTVDITSAAAWAGDITVGITCNNPEPNSGGFFSG